MKKIILFLFFSLANEETFKTFMRSEDNLTIEKNIHSQLKQRLVT